jgi:head-tail adaptor
MIADFFTITFSRYTMAPGVAFPYDLAETLIGTFAGGIQQLRGEEMWLDQKMTKKATHRIFCPSSTTILYTDRIKYGARVFEVRGVDDVELKTGHHKEVLVEEIA